MSDVNADGRTDLLVAIEDLDVVKVFHQGGDLRLATKAVEHPTGETPIGLVVGDLNHDGRKDVLVLQRAPGVLAKGIVFEQDQDGRLEAAHDLKISSETSAEPRSAVITDLNGDGKDDVAIAPTGGNEVLVFHQDDSGSLGLDEEGLRRWNCSFHSGSPPSHLSSGDLNGDEHPDLVVTTNLDFLVRLFVQRPAVEEAGLDPPPSPCDSLFTPAGRLGKGGSTAVGDLTGDGRAELVIATGATGVLIVLVGR